LAEQLLHLRLIAAGPERQQTAQRHVGLGLTVVADRVSLQSRSNFWPFDAVSRFLEEVLVFEVNVNVDATARC